MASNPLWRGKSEVIGHYTHTIAQYFYLGSVPTNEYLVHLLKGQTREAENVLFMKYSIDYGLSESTSRNHAKIVIGRATQLISNFPDFSWGSEQTFTNWVAHNGLQNASDEAKVIFKLHNFLDEL